MSKTKTDNRLNNIVSNNADNIVSNKNPKFSKRHYIIIASIIKALRNKYVYSKDYNKVLVMKEVKDTCIELFKKDNPKFDEQRFHNFIIDDRYG